MESPRKVLAIDYGQKRIGLAFGQGDEVWVLDPLVVKTEEEAIAALDDLCRKKGVGLLVLGLPLSAEGAETEMAKSIKKFGEKLKKVTGLSLLYWNEVLTTQAAQNYLLLLGRSRRTRKRLKDSFAAGILLKEYLENPE